jgi:hypothetical protein
VLSCNKTDPSPISVSHAYLIIFSFVSLSMGACAWSQNSVDRDDSAESDEKQRNVSITCAV